MCVRKGEKVFNSNCIGLPVTFSVSFDFNCFILDNKGIQYCGFINIQMTVPRIHTFMTNDLINVGCY